MASDSTLTFISPEVPCEVSRGSTREESYGVYGSAAPKEGLFECASDIVAYIPVIVSGDGAAGQLNEDRKPREQKNQNGLLRESADPEGSMWTYVQLAFQGGLQLICVVIGDSRGCEGQDLLRGMARGYRFQGGAGARLERGAPPRLTRYRNGFKALLTLRPVSSRIVVTAAYSSWTYSQDEVRASAKACGVAFQPDLVQHAHHELHHGDGARRQHTPWGPGITRHQRKQPSHVRLIVTWFPAFRLFLSHSHRHTALPLPSSST